MYTVVDYIALARSVKRVRYLLKENPTGFIDIEDDPENPVRVDLTEPIYSNEQSVISRINKLRDIIQLSVPATLVQSVVSIHNRDMGIKPVFLMYFKLDFILVPLLITKSSVLIIKPFDSNSVNTYDSSFEILLDYDNINPDIDTPEILHSCIGDCMLKDIIESKVNKYKNTFYDRFKLLQDMIGNTDLIDSMDLSTSSDMFKKIKNSYNISEEFTENYTDDVLVDDYLPIFVTNKDDGCSLLKLIDYIDGKTENRVVRSKVIATATLDGFVSSVRNDSYSRQILLLKDGDKYPSSIIYMSENQYLYNGQILTYMNGSVTDRIMISDHITSSYSGIEAVEFRDIIYTLRKMGIRVTTGLKSFIVNLSKLPKDLIKKILSDLKRLLFRFDKDIEKEDTERYQKKALEDNLDATEEMWSHYSRVALYAGVSGVAFSSVFVGILALLYWRVDDKRLRLRAINRSITNFRNRIERVNTAAEIARQESRYEELINLQKEKQMLENSIRELTILKRNNYGKQDKEYNEKYPDLAPDSTINKEDKMY